MGEPAAVMGDMIVGGCVHSLVALGAPGPLPFSAPLSQSLAATVLIGGRAAAVAGSFGLCTPPHAGVLPADPFFAPPIQQGKVISGSATVLIEGRPAAKTGSPSMTCMAPAQLTGTAANVLIGA
jgi:uncharacterized Zn-binding protein involved in type VI secretion